MRAQLIHRQPERILELLPGADSPGVRWGHFLQDTVRWRFTLGMPILRLAYTTLFLLALLAVFEIWSQVGGQSHLDLMPWYLKLGLGAGAAFSIVKATSAAVSHERGWNGQTLRWTGILLILLIGCGLASYYYHVYGEQEEDQEDDESVTSSLVVPAVHRPMLGNVQRV